MLRVPSLILLINCFLVLCFHLLSSYNLVAPIRSRRSLASGVFRSIPFLSNKNDFNESRDLLAPFHATWTSNNLSSAEGEQKGNSSIPPRRRNITPTEQTQTWNQSELSLPEKFLVPEDVGKLLHSRVLGRLETVAVTRECLFELISQKHRNTASQWGNTRFVVYECSKKSGGCGGLGDRMKGLFSVFFHAVAIGYEFRIDWDSPVPLSPEILVPTRWINWTSRSHWPDKAHALRFKDTGQKPFGLCNWRQYGLVKMHTNGHPIPRGHQDCDDTKPGISEILLNQSITRACIQGASNRWIGGSQCMGCIWWYLFKIGQRLKMRLVEELQRLYLWKRERRLENAFSIALHVRAGDTNMKAGQGREARDSAALVHQIERCAADFAQEINGQYHLVLVSDSEQVKSLVRSWQWTQVYIARTKPFHIDKSRAHSKVETMEAATSVLVDLFLLAFQDALLLSGTSGYGYMAQGVGMHLAKNVVSCI
eukprot:Tamp_07834.p1 GENE.Tamp_07834~~Tamp_07834.p1  ORF type:complete len:481 (+),score=5.33 Tamp_07834:96-1538(+)